MKSIFAFILGAAVGSAVTWKIIKDRCIQDISEVEEDSEILDDEHTQDISEATDEGPKKEIKADIADYTKIIDINAYNTYYTTSNTLTDMCVSDTEEEEVDSVDGPYVITPEEFGENDEYDVISLTHYADNVLADDMDELVEDIDNIVGYGYYTHFGEYEDDSVFIRNDRLKTDYEILLDTRNYSDVVESWKQSETE